MAYVKLPFEQKEADLDNALLLIRQNIPKLISRVSEGMDLHVEECNHNQTIKLWPLKIREQRLVHHVCLVT